MGVFLEGADATERSHRGRGRGGWQAATFPLPWWEGVGGGGRRHRVRLTPITPFPQGEQKLHLRSSGAAGRGPFDAPSPGT